jgi:hypothetical protein
MTTQHADQMEAAYGPFQPGTVARAIRNDHARAGFRTCWFCLGPFRPTREIGPDGRLRRPGRGRWYCSRSCALADRSTHAHSTKPTIEIVGGELVLDLRRLRGVVA